MAIVRKREEMVVRVQDLDLARELLQVTCFEILRAFDVNQKTRRRLLLGANADTLEVQDDFGDVLNDSLDRREFVEYAIHSKRRECAARDRGEKNAAHGIAQRRSISFFQWRGNKTTERRSL
jgi:hypothetical protein